MTERRPVCAELNKIIFFEGDPPFLCAMEPRDIETRDDLIVLLEAFYKKATDDSLIGHFFTEVVALDLQTHIPVIADFWESVVLEERVYRKNVLEVHQHLHARAPIGRPHFDRWVGLFSQTVDALFSGPRAELIKQRGRSIATLMDLKLNHSGVGRG